MEDLEEMVIVAVPVSRAYAGWAEFQSFFLYLSCRRPSNPAPGSRHSEGRGPRQLESAAGPVSDRFISWSTVFAGNRHAGVVVFSPLDENATRVSARFAWPAGDVGPDINCAELAEELLRFKDFVECPPSASQGTARAGNRF